MAKTEEIIRKHKKITAPKRKRTKKGQSEQYCSSIAIPTQVYDTRSAIYPPKSSFTLSGEKEVCFDLPPTIFY